MAEIGREAVRHVHLGVCAARELAPLGQAQRRPEVAAGAERGARTAERAGDDERVARLGAGAARYALAPPEGGDADRDDGRGRRVAADHGHACLHDPFVEREHVVELGLAGEGETDEEAFGKRTGRSEVADVHRGGAEAELAPREPVE